MSMLSKAFNLEVNSLTSSIPTELGQFKNVTGDYYLRNNLLCGSIPSQLSRLSSSVNDPSTWELVEGNNLEESWGELNARGGIDYRTH